MISAHKLLDSQQIASFALLRIHESIEPIIPGSDAYALSANSPNNCDRAFNLFFIHSLAPPFLSLVVVLCDAGVDVVLVHIPNFEGVAGSEDFACATLPTTPIDFQSKIFVTLPS